LFREIATPLPGTETGESWGFPAPKWITSIYCSV
jgi:hypothetical protein